MSLSTTLEAAGRGPVVVNVPVDELKKAEEQTTIAVDKVEPGRDIFAAGEKKQNMESLPPVEPVNPNDEPKEISSLFRTESPGAASASGGEKILLPDENPATTVAAAAVQENSDIEKKAEKPTSSSSSVSSATSSSPSSSPSSSSSSSSQEASTATKVAGPLDHEEAEAERVREELFPDAMEKN